MEAAIEIHYQVQQTQTRLVVTPKMRSEVIQSKMALQDLGVISLDIPNVLHKLKPARTAGTSPEPSPNERGTLPEPAPNTASEKEKKAETGETQKVQTATDRQGDKPESPKKLAMLKLERMDEEGPLQEIFDKLVGLYNHVFDDLEELKPMIGPAYEIEMKKEPIKPLHLNVACKTPFAFRDGAKQELQRLVDQGILRWFEEG